MTKLFRIFIGGKNVVASPKNVRKELKEKLKVAKRDNKTFKRGFNDFGITIDKGELWLVGYKETLTFHKNLLE